MMNITKPQKVKLEILENMKILENVNNEDIEYKSFLNETHSSIKIFDMQFSHCIFSNIHIQESTLEKIVFSDVIFNNCDFSNTDFIDNTFIRCEFNNCKLLVVIYQKIDYLML